MTTRIYNVCTAAAILLLTAALTAACTDTLQPRPENDLPGEGKFICVTATQGDGAETRVTHTPDGNGNFLVRWAATDRIHVGKRPAKDAYVKGSQFLSSLDIAEGGADQSKARFEGTIAAAHQPTPGDTLFAHYGKLENIIYCYNEIGYEYAGQRQTANNSREHLTDYDFMSAIATYDATPGADHHFSFSHAGSMMKFTLGGLEGQTVKTLTLCTDDGSPAFAYSYGLTRTVSLDLGAEDGSGIAIPPGGKLEAYLMMGATKRPAGKRLVLYAATTDDNYYLARLTGTEIAAGKSYTVEARLTLCTGFEGQGTIDEPYKITTPGDLTKLSMMLNAGMLSTKGKYFRLTGDIDLSGVEEWVPIGINVVEQSFTGIFSGEKEGGGNYSVTGLKCKPASLPSTYRAGLFGNSYGGTIKNVTVSGEIVVNGTKKELVYAAGIVGESSAGTTVENCVSRCTIRVSNAKRAYAGGIIASSSGNGNKDSSGWMPGNTVKNCRNEGDISSCQYTGGIFGEMYASCSATGCTNTGSITSSSTEYPAGGIIGYLYLNGLYQRGILTGWQHSGTTPAQGAPGSIIGSYLIYGHSSNDDNLSRLVLKENEGDTETVIESPFEEDTVGKWPAEASGQ